MNNYTYNRANIKQAIEHLSGGEAPAPSFVIDNPNIFSTKDGKLHVGKKLVVAQEDGPSLLRALLYERDPKGKWPFGRDSLHHSVLQAFVGVSRRKIMTFLRKQGVLQDVRHLPNEVKRGKWKVFDLGSVQIDLVHARKVDQVSADWFGSGEDRFWLTAVEQGTSFFQARFILSKSPKHVAPALKQILDVMGKHFEVKRIFADAGKEFLGEVKELLEERKIRFTTGSRGSSIENANATFQRYFYVIARMRRGSLLDSTKQAEATMNNLYNRRIHMTPNQGVKLAKELGQRAFLKQKRKLRRTVAIVPRYKVGQRVRPLEMRRKDAGIGYKSYKGKAWQRKIETIESIKKNPIRYVLSSGDLLALDEDPLDKLSQSLVQERAIPEADESYYGKHDQAWEPEMPIDPEDIQVKPIDPEDIPVKRVPIDPEDIPVKRVPKAKPKEKSKYKPKKKPEELSEEALRREIEEIERRLRRDKRRERKRSRRERRRQAAKRPKRRRKAVDYRAVERRYDDDF